MDMKQLIARLNEIYKDQILFRLELLESIPVIRYILL